jgi:hypothetical protein
MPASYASPSVNDPVMTIKELKSTVKEAVAENPQNALQQALGAGDASLQQSVAASKDLTSFAGQASTAQKAATQAATAQLQASQSEQGRMNNQIDMLSPLSGNNRGYSPLTGGSSVASMNDPGTANKVNQMNAAIQRQKDEADRATQAGLQQRQSLIDTANTQQLNAQQNVSAQALAATQAQAQKDVAATQAAAAIQAAQYGALGSILSNSGGGGGRHQYW